MESESALGGMLYRHPLLDHMGGGTFVSPTYTEFMQGEADPTSRDLDIFIKGPGFLPVANGDEVCYTRDGRLTLDGEGMLVMVDGERRILDATGRSIQLDPSKQTLIGEDGTISQDNEMVARLDLAHFEDPHVLRKIGDGLYANPSGVAPEPRRADLATGVLEKSGVDPVKELVTMIEAQRAYEANAHSIRLQDETLRMVVNNLGRNL